MSSLVQELELARARVTQLEQVDADRKALLAGLPAAYGFANVDDFVRALRAIHGYEKSPSRIKSSFTGSAKIAVIAPPVGISKAAAEAAAPKPALVEATAPASEVPAHAPAGIAAAAAPPDAVSAAKALPTGTSLKDPANFGQLPDLSLLEKSDLADQVYRAQLNGAVVFAQQVLHTSKVPAAVWREWRDFVRKAGEALRAPLAS